MVTLFSVAIRLGFAEDVIMDGANPNNFGLIIGVIVLCFLTAVAAVTACFFKRVKKEEVTS